MTNTTTAANAAQTPMGQGAEVATAAPKNDLHPCACGGITFRAFGADETRLCPAATKRTFAPGHDAKLKGELIRRELAGDVVVLASGEVISPTMFAGSFGFADMVAEGVRRGIDKAAAKADKAAAKADKAAAKADKAAAKADKKAAKGKKAERKLAEKAGIVKVIDWDQIAKPEVAPEPAKVQAKVGRWVYEGVILAAGDGQPVFRYTDKKGASQDTMKFTRV